MLRIVFTVMAAVLVSGSLAQTAPSQSEISGYEGLLRAAHAGDVAVINWLVAEGADVNVRDESARTPIHLTAFASHDDALRAVAATGADINALDNCAYDVVTIAAVANAPTLRTPAESCRVRLCILRFTIFDVGP